MSEKWHISRDIGNGLPHWVSLNKGNPMLPFAFVHEDEAEEIVADHNAALMTPAEVERYVDAVMNLSPNAATAGRA